MKFCQNCGKKIPSNAKFCSYCGAKQVNMDSINTQQNDRQDSLNREYNREQKREDEDRFLNKMSNKYFDTYQQAREHYNHPVSYDIGYWFGYNESLFEANPRRWCSTHKYILIPVGIMILFIILFYLFTMY